MILVELDLLRITRTNLNDYESESHCGKPMHTPHSETACSIRGTAVTAGFWETIFVSFVATMAVLLVSVSSQLLKLG